MAKENQLLKIGFIAVLVIAVMGFAFFMVQALTLNSNANFEHSEEQFQVFAAAETEDKCTVPEGYTEADWKQHMSHHPERYEGCL
jgi:hypothetical protein